MLKKTLFKLKIIAKIAYYLLMVLSYFDSPLASLRNQLETESQSCLVIYHIEIK